MADNKVWINAAMQTARAGRPVLVRRLLSNMYSAVIEEAMRRDEFAVAAEYQQRVDELRGEVGR
jgi:hypothetical protein